MGLPYALSSDLVSAWPAKSLEVAQYVDGQVPLLAMTQNAQTGTTYTFVLTDFTKLVTLSNASAVAVTLPLESSVAWPTGTQLRLLNQGAGTVTVAGAVGVTINGSPLTLTQYKGANLIKTGTNTWVFIPFASGVGAAVFSDTPTGTYTGFAYKTFTASGTLNVTTAGFATLVVCAGGGGGTVGGGGAGGVAALTDVYLPVGTLTVTVGAGGTGGASLPSDYAAQNGSPSLVGSYVAVGGGGGTYAQNGMTGGSGGGATSSKAGGTGLSGQGFAGGTGTGANGGGGGGAAAIGGDLIGTTGGAGGAGTTTSIAGTTPSGAYVAGSYALGGGGGGGASGTGGAGGSGGGGAGVVTGTANAGAANKGGGGGGQYTANDGANGGSGLVIVRVAV